MALKLPTIEQIKTSLYDIQRKRLPTLPKSRSDVQFTDEWTMTSSGKPFLLADDGLGDNKLIMFATDDNIAIFVKLILSTLMELFKHVQNLSIRFTQSMHLSMDKLTFFYQTKQKARW